MNDLLGAPEAEDDLYLARADEVSPYRPILQGDIFESVTIAGVETPHSHALVIAHPCSMRAGPLLKPRLQMVPVIRHDGLPFSHWAKGHFGILPLPNLLLDGDHYAASFEETGMVSTADLMPDRRICCLTEGGLLLLQQRYVHHLTRVVVPPYRLGQVSGPMLTEVELQEDWNTELVYARVERGEDSGDALAAEAKAFHDFIRSAGREGEVSLQVQLGDPLKQSDVRRKVRQEIARRHEEDFAAAAGHGEAEAGGDSTA
jgi:hypothetical protein